MHCSTDRCTRHQLGTSSDIYSVRDRIANGRPEPAPVRAAHDKGDVMFRRLKAGKFGRIALGSGEPAGEYEVHDAHVRVF